MALPARNLSGAAALRPVALLVATACAAGPAADAPATLRATFDGSVCRVGTATRPLLVYRYTGTRYKPYVEQLFTPQGVQILRDAPPDHVHHHGLMLAYGLDEDLDFWGEIYVKHAGRQVGGPVRVRRDPDAGGRARCVLAQSVEWIDDRIRTTVLHEERAIEVAEPRPNAPALVTWRSRLSVPPRPGKVRLWGRHYFGLGMRFVESMDRTGRFVTARGEVGKAHEPGKVVRGDERLLHAGWCAYLAECAGRTVTVAMFDHPDNPRHPATWFTMRRPFAYLSATLGLHGEPMQIETAHPLQIEYGVALWDGAVTADVIEKTYRRWQTAH